MCKNGTIKSIIIGLIFCMAVQAQQPFKSSKFVTIGQTGNSADTTGKGAVDHTYWISKTAVTVAEWTPFYNNYSAVGGMGTLSTNYRNIAIGSGLSDSDAGVYYVSTAEAAMYCNWLTTGSATTGVYTLGTNTSNYLTIMGINRDFRNADGIAYVLPTENEWYKAAFYKADGSGYSDYTDGTDTAPALDEVSGYWYGALDINTQSRAVGAGAVEQNGTYNMMGINWEWVEIAAGASRGLGRGGRVIPPTTGSLTSKYANQQLGGFRVAVIGNPARVSLFFIH